MLLDISCTQHSVANDRLIEAELYDNVKKIAMDYLKTLTSHSYGTTDRKHSFQEHSEHHAHLLQFADCFYYITTKSPVHDQYLLLTLQS
jgi:hypothetical protein